MLRIFPRVGLLLDMTDIFSSFHLNFERIILLIGPTLSCCVQRPSFNFASFVLWAFM